MEKKGEQIESNNLKNFLLATILLIAISSTASADFSSITSISPDPEFSETIDLTKKVYEISRSALQEEIILTLKEKEIIKLDESINGRMSAFFITCIVGSISLAISDSPLSSSYG